MNLSDSSTVSHADTWPRDLLAAWSLITTRTAVQAAQSATAEQVRSLRVLVTQMSAQVEADQWESVTAATYFGIAEAGGNEVYESLVYDLWHELIGAGDRWDVAARLWPLRHWVEQSLQAVIEHIVASEVAAAGAAMDAHLRTVLSTLEG
jgi:DNA-binding FadR family transcriptional regulator